MRKNHRTWEEVPRKHRAVFCAVMGAVFVLGLLVVVSLIAPGCTRGQLTPSEIKNPTYAARADAIVTAREIKASMERRSQSDLVLLQEAIDALERIGGTPEKAYDDGLLAPVWHYFRGTKPSEASP